MSVNNNIQFFANTPDDTHCFQAALKMILKYYFPEKDFSFEDLDKATDKIENLWTWPMAGIMWLQSLGLEVKNVEIFDYDVFARQGTTYLQEFYGKDVAAEQVANSDIQQSIKYAQQFAGSAITDVRLPDISEIYNLLDDGYLIECNINGAKLNSEPDYYGHSIVISGYEGTDLIIQDPGAPPLKNRVVSQKDFEAAWAYPNEKAKNYLAVRLKN